MIERVESIVNHVEDGLALGLVSVIVLSVFLQVFCRYILQAPLSWTEELARSCLIYLTFVGSSLAIRLKGHFVLEILVMRLPCKLHLVWELILLGIILFFLGVLLVYGTLMLPMLSLQMSASLQIPMSYIYLAIPIGSSLMFFHVFLMIWRRMRHGVSTLPRREN